MNTYNAYYKNKVIEVKAETSYKAQQKAANQLSAKKAYDVTVLLCNRADGSTVIHTPDF